MLMRQWLQGSLASRLTSDWSGDIPDSALIISKVQKNHPDCAANDEMRRIK